MPRLSAFLPVLALASLARGQNVSSATGTAAIATPANPTSSAAPASETVVTLPAWEVAQEGENNSTMTAVWSTDTGRGTLTQGLTLLQNSTGTARNESVYGVVLEFNSTLAVSNESMPTDIPWIAYISCDEPSEVITQFTDGALSASAGLPAFSASAASPSATGVSTNGTAMNGTSALNSTSVQLQTLDLMERAEELGAQAILLYSTIAQSCTLNYTAFNYTTFNSSTSSNSSLPTNSSSPLPTTNTTLLSNGTIPIFTSPSTQVTNIILDQFSNLPPSHAYFNSTLLTEATANLSSIISAATNSSSGSSGGGGGISLSSPTQFLLARIRPFYDSTSSNNGIVATIGVANPSTQQPTATGSTGAQPSQTGGGGDNAAAGGKRSKVTLAATGFVAGALIAGVGALI
ncbi:hypothetical protein JCM6882_001964 [Rhodosporidiobolus microsporus]